MIAASNAACNEIVLTVNRRKKRLLLDFNMLMKKKRKGRSSALPFTFSLQHAFDVRIHRVEIVVPVFAVYNTYARKVTHVNGLCLFLGVVKLILTFSTYLSQVAMWLEIFIIKHNQTYRQPCVVDARDKTRLFLNFFLEQTNLLRRLNVIPPLGRPIHLWKGTETIFHRRNKENESCTKIGRCSRIYEVS